MSGRLAPALSLPLRGWQVIEASAGTGKTWTITALIARVLIERGLSADRVLVMTYTRAATAELRSRIRSRLIALERALGGSAADDSFVADYLCQLGDHEQARRQLRQALASMDEFPIQTIHGFCQRVQAQFGLAWGESEAASITTDVRRFVRRAAVEYFRELIARRTDGRAWIAELLVLLGLEPEGLLDLFQQALSHPAAAARPGSIDLMAPARRFVQARESAQALWSTDRDVYLAAISRDARLRGGRYKQYLSNWAGKIDAYFAQGAALPDTNGNLAWSRLSDEGLRAFVEENDIDALHPRLPRALGELRRSALEVAGWHRLLAREFRDWAPEPIARYKREAGEQEHDDAVRALWRALRDDAQLADALRRRFPVCFVDEGQDTDSLQWEILARVYGRDASDTALFYVGDPKQAIYRFRGADVYTYLAASRQVGSVSRLTHNRRSTPGLVAAVNALFDRRDAFAVDEIGFESALSAPAGTTRLVDDGRVDAQPFRWVWLAADALHPEPSIATDSADAIAGPPGNEPAADTKTALNALAADACAAEIARLLEASRSGRLHYDEGDDPAPGEGRDGDPAARSRAVHPRDIAVLVYSHRQAALVRAALAERGVRASERSRESVLDSPEAQALWRIVAAIVDPADAALVRGAWATHLLGAEATQLERSNHDEVLLQRWTDELLGAQWRWRIDGPLPALRELAARTGMVQRLAPQREGARAWTNVLHLLEMLHQAQPPLRSPQAAVAWFEQSREHGSDAFELRLDSDADLVQLVTVHRSKGLEYSIVFVPFAWTGRRPDPDPVILDHDPANGWSPVLDFGVPLDDEVERRARREVLAESVRQLYVALTRAQHRCYVFWGRAKDAEHTALAWLLHGGQGPGRKGALPDGGEMRRALAAHVDACGGVGRVDTLAQILAGAPSKVQSDVAPAQSLAARTMARGVRRAWRLLSYTGLVQGREPAAEARDHDQYQPHEARPPGGDAELAGLAAGIRERFPRGAEAGQCLHEILERVDFGAVPDVALCGRILTRYGMSERLAGEVAQWLGEVFNTPLQAWSVPGSESGAPAQTVPLTLAGVGRERRITELGFDLSLPRGGVAGFWRAIGQGLSAHHGVLPEFAAAQAGLLRGFVDLVFEHQGRFHIVDWKSNWLGPAPGDYDGERLAVAMRASAYDVQYLLYVVALDRWLRQRVPGYRYESHFGGVWYLFLRGVAPNRPGAGVFFARPAPGVIDAVDAALSQGGRA